MRGIKGFLIVFVAAYMAISLGLNFTLGPPGMSASYLETYKRDHDRYIEVTKSDAYKRWRERPELNPPGPQTAGAFAFVEEYEARPEFKSEMQRRGIYELLFDILNTLALITLAVRFGRGPIGHALDGMIARVRQSLDDAKRSREDAAARKHAAELKIQALPDEEASVRAQHEERIVAMRREAALFTGQSLSLLNKETADRKNLEETLARRALKEELVEAAFASLEERIRRDGGDSNGTNLVDAFVRELERPS